MANANVGITVTWSGQAAVAGVSRLENQMDELIATVQRLGVVTASVSRQQIASINQVNNAANRATRTFSLMKTVLQGVGAVAGLTFVANILRNVATYAINTAGEFQSLQTQMGLATGSAQAGAVATVDLLQALQKVGGSPLDGIKLFARLTLLGVENAKAMTVAVGGLSASLGLNSDATQRVNMAIAQIYSKGDIVRAEEFNGQLAEQIPIAAILAAGFQKMGDKTRDTAKEVSASLANQTLKTKEFFEAFQKGSADFINNNAVLTNVAVQYGNLIDTIKILIGVQGELTGVTAGFAIVMNALSGEILDYFKTFKVGTIEQQANAVKNVTDKVLDFIGAIEASIRFTAGLVNALVGIGRVGVAIAQALVTAFVSVGYALAELNTAFITKDFTRFNAVVQGTQSRFGQLFKDVEAGASQAGQGISQLNGNLTEFTDKLRSRVGQTDFVAAVRDRVNIRQPPGDNSAGDQANKAAQARAEALRKKLEDMMVNLQGLSERASTLTRGPLTALAEGVEKAKDPFDKLNIEVLRMMTNFEQLGLSEAQLAPIREKLNGITEASTAASRRAVAAFEAQYAAEQKLADISNQRTVSGIAEQARAVVEKVTIRFESEGQEQARKAEDELRLARAENIRKISELEIQRGQALAVLDEATAARKAAEIEAYRKLGVELDNTNGALIVAATRWNTFYNSLRSTLQDGLASLITGLTDFRNFDFGAWASGIVNQITQSIATQWASQITDKIFSMLGIGKPQVIGQQVVQNQIVGGGIGGGGGGGGGILSSIGSLFGGGKSGGAKGGGGAGGGIMSTIGSFFSKIPFFADGGILGGPTMLAVGGEKGKEGVLPLERVGGQLGVSAAGVGGDSYHFSINAIDTQTGAQFLMQHMDTIIGGMSSRRALGTA